MWDNTSIMGMQNNISRIVTIAIAVLAVVAVLVNVHIVRVKGQTDSTNEQIPALEEQKSAAQATSQDLQTQVDDQVVEWRNAQGRLSFLGDGTGKVCYLTFDDGPCDALTKKNLKILKKKGAVATWFCLANVEEYEYLNLDLCKTIEDQGSAVGIHDWDQNDSYDYYKGTVEDYFTNDFDKAKEKLEEAVGHEIKIMRFAGGSPTIGYYNSAIAKSLPQEMVKRGYQYFDWNVLAGDSEAAQMVNGSVPVETIKDNILGEAKEFAKTDSPICVLMHDNPGKDTTTEALPDVIDGLKKLGYEFKTLSYDTPGFYQLVIKDD